MKHDFLVLNIDKTIFDVVEPVQRAYQHLARRYDLDIPPVFLERVLDTHGSSRDRLDRQFYRLAKLHSQAAELTQQYIAEAITNKTLLPRQAEDFLRFLNEQDIPYGVVSSLPRRFVEQMHATFPVFQPSFSIVQAEILEGKPEPDLYLMAARKAGVHPTRLLAIESTPLGAESAFLANAKVIYMGDDPQPDNPASAYSQQSVNDLNELVEYLEKTLKKS